MSEKNGSPNIGVVPPLVSVDLENTQINKFHTKGGTGFAAEEANSALDRLKGLSVDQVGRNNELNGADRIVDGVQIQTKYFDTAAGTMRSAFDDQGVFRYSGQMLEVPSDQYDECLRLMREKISAGRVPGVTDPDMAVDLVKKGQITYRQARNIARPGNIDSLVFDAATQAVTTGSAFAISFVVGFSRAKWAGSDNGKAIDESLAAGLQCGATSFVTGIATAQILRTRAAAVGAIIMRDGVKSVASTTIGKSAVEKVAEVSLGRAVYGAAATNHVAKLLRTNVLGSVVATAVIATPDFYRAAFRGSISWSQLGKNLAINGAGAAGGVGGWMAGAAAGAAIGSALLPGAGTVAGAACGTLGAVAGGMFAGSASKAVLDKFVDDDAKAMIALLPDAMQPLAEDYLLSELETMKFIDIAKVEIDAGFLRDMYASADRMRFVYQRLEFICESIAKERPKVQAPTSEEIQAHLRSLEARVEETVDEDVVQEVVPEVVQAERQRGAHVPCPPWREWLHRPDPDLDFLRKIRSEDLDPLVRTLSLGPDGRPRATESLTGHALYRAHTPDHRMYWDLVAAEIQRYGANSIATLARGGRGVLYREVLGDVCDRLSVAHDRKEVTEHVERALLGKLVDDFIRKTPDEQLLAISSSVGLDGVAALKGPALAAALLAAYQAGGMMSQRITLVMTAAILKLLLGRSLPVGLGVMMPPAAAGFGPIGWALTGLWAAFDLASPAYRVTVPATLQISVLRRQYLMEWRGEIDGGW